jgi:hypothetical protein
MATDPNTSGAFVGRNIGAGANGEAKEARMPDSGAPKSLDKGAGRSSELAAVTVPTIPTPEGDATAVAFAGKAGSIGPATAITAAVRGEPCCAMIKSSWLDAPPRIARLFENMPPALRPAGDPVAGSGSFDAGATMTKASPARGSAPLWAAVSDSKALPAKMAARRAWLEAVRRRGSVMLPICSTNVQSDVK